MLSLIIENGNNKEFFISGRIALIFKLLYEPEGKAAHIIKPRITFEACKFPVIKNQQRNLKATVRR